MRPEDVPQELIDILDRHAGRQHSRQGSVVRALAEILTAYDASRTIAEMPRKKLVHLVLMVTAELVDGQLTQDDEAVRQAALEQLDDVVIEVQDDRRDEPSEHRLTVISAELVDPRTVDSRP